MGGKFMLSSLHARSGEGPGSNPELDKKFIYNICNRDYYIFKFKRIFSKKKRIEHSALSAVSGIWTCDLRITILVLYLYSTAAYTFMYNFKK